MNGSKTPPDSQTIQNLFDALSGRYDLFNRLTSFGQDIRWRKAALEELKPGMTVLDLGCGTGDLSILAAKKLGNQIRVVGIDFSEKMLARAKERAAREPSLRDCRITFLRKKAEDLPIEPGAFDLVLSGFVLRNIYENIDSVLRGVHESLRPQGLVSFLDFTEPAGALCLYSWRFYMLTAVALYGKILFGAKYPARYMTESAKRFVKPPDFVRKLEKAGFRDIRVRFFMLGSIVLYRARK